MAVTGINGGGGSRQPKESALDVISKGLSIAQSVFQIGSSVKQMGALDDQTKKTQLETQKLQTDVDQEKRFQNNQFYQHELSGKKLLPAKEGDANAFDVNILLPGGKLTPMKVKPAADLDQLVKETTVMKNLNDLKGEPVKAEGARLENEAKRKALESSTPDQGKAASFAQRMDQAEAVFAKLENEGFDRASYTGAGEANLFGAIQPGLAKRQNQAETNFVSAVLRRESGAAISPKEFELAEELYFPRAGDDEQTKLQKAQTRLAAIEGIRAEAGSNAMGKIQPIPAGRGNPAKSGGVPGVAEAQASSLPPVVKQNGHTYHLNQKTGKYE